MDRIQILNKFYEKIRFENAKNLPSEDKAFLEKKDNFFTMQALVKGQKLRLFYTYIAEENHFMMVRHQALTFLPKNIDCNEIKKFIETCLYFYRFTFQRNNHPTSFSHNWDLKVEEDAFQTIQFTIKAKSNATSFDQFYKDHGEFQKEAGDFAIQTFMSLHKKACIILVDSTKGAHFVQNLGPEKIKA